MYRYSGMEFKNFVTKVHKSPEMMTNFDVDNVIQMFCSMDNFQYEGVTHPYVFTEIIDYRINWNQKERNLEDLERLQTIFEQIDEGLLIEDMHFTDKEWQKIKAEGGETLSPFYHRQMDDKMWWKEQWLTKIQNEIMLQAEQHKSL